MEDIPTPRSFLIVGAPTALGLASAEGSVEPGCCMAPRVLRSAGLSDRLQARDLGDLVLPNERDAIPPGPGRAWNTSQIARSSRLIADAVEPHLLGRSVPIVVGGDCSVLVGVGLAVSRRTRLGLVFLDAHTDAYTPETSRSRQVAAMELGIVLGKTLPELANIEQRAPYFSAHTTAVVGYRDHGERQACGAEDPARWTELAFPVERFKRLGARRVAQAILCQLRSAPVEGVWVHFDVDVLDPSVMPAVDTPEPDGLSYGDVLNVIRAFRDSGFLAGMDVTIYDPTRDPRRSCARDLVACLAGVA